MWEQKDDHYFVGTEVFNVRPGKSFNLNITGHESIITSWNVTLEEVEGHDINEPKPRKTIVNGEGLVVWTEQGRYDMSTTVDSEVGQSTLDSLEKKIGLQMDANRQAFFEHLYGNHLQLKFKSLLVSLV